MNSLTNEIDRLRLSKGVCEREFREYRAQVWNYFKFLCTNLRSLLHCILYIQVEVIPFFLYIALYMSIVGSMMRISRKRCTLIFAH